MTSEKKTSKFRLKIKWKVLIRLLLMSAVILAVLWAGTTYLFPSIYKKVRQNDLETAEKTVLDAVWDDDADEVCKSVAAKYDVCVLIQNNYALETASGEGLGACVIHRIDVMERNKLISDAEYNGGTDLGYYRYDASSNTLIKTGDSGGENGEHVIRTVIVENGKDRLVVFFNSVLYPVSSTVRTIRISLTYISIILLFVSVLFSIIISYGVSKPISDLTSEAEKLSEASYVSGKIKSKSREIAELDETLGKASEELKQNERLKSELIANVSHDLRTPLTMISGYAEVMRDIPGEVNSENLQIIIDETKHLSSLVNDMLEISKLRSGSVRIEKSEYDLTEDVMTSVNHFDALMKNEAYSIEFCFTDHAFVHADRDRIMQVIYNLIGNAVTHTGEDKTVKVVQRFITDDGKNAVKIDVCDSGPGIAAEDLPYIWDRYYKVDKFHKRSAEGSGLGLSIVKSVIEANGGKYGVETGENGSVFYFTLFI